MHACFKVEYCDRAKEYFIMRTCDNKIVDVSENEIIAKLVCSEYNKAVGLFVLSEELA
jgi:hypothetical protein